MAAALSFIIGIIGNIISILVFASPIKTFFQVVKKKSTENYKSIPYITTLLSTSLWTFYGLLKPGGLLISTVNGTGVVFQFIYVTLFLIYAPNLLKVKTAKLVGILNVGFLGLVIAVSLVALHGSVRLTFVGILCAALTVGMYASPLSAMRLVIKTKSVEYMPFFLSFFLFLNAGIWSAYAVLVQDFFVGVPNGVGVLLGSAQLILYAVYKNKSNIMSTKSTEKMEEESPAHLVKGIIQMQAFHEDDEEALKNRSLDKGRSLPKPPVNREYGFQSLPKPPVNREYGFQRILKTFSLNLYEVDSNSAQVDDLENGEKIHP